MVNLRVGGLEEPEPGSIAEQFTALAELRQQGLIRHLGLSTVNAEQLAEAQAIAPVVCVQNMYNIARRADDALVDQTARAGHRVRALLPARRVQPGAVRRTERGRRRGSAPRRWPSRWPGCCSRSPNILLIPGTSSVDHLRENVAAAALDLADVAAELDAIGRP